MNIHAASDKYSGAVWSATFRIKSAFYMENGVDFEAFKANENVKTFVNAFVKESRRRWKNNDSNKTAWWSFAQIIMQSLSIRDGEQWTLRRTDNDAIFGRDNDNDKHKDE